MKYFTPDLLLRFGAQDDAVANAAQEEWDLTCDRYNSYLDSLKGQMTPGLLRIEENYLLHDADIRSLGQQGHSFVIVLQLDAPPEPLLTFSFDLLDEPMITPNALPKELCSKGTVVEWQYDELALLPGATPTWSWSILLSNGWELCLHFRNVQVQEVQAIFPAPRNGHVPVGVAPLSQPA